MLARLVLAPRLVGLVLRGLTFLSRLAGEWVLSLRLFADDLLLLFCSFVVLPPYFDDITELALLHRRKRSE